ncbi:MAG: PAS domain-containing protein, partial [Bacteroidota bacterium]
MPAPSVSLVLGDVSADGRHADSWEAFCAHAEAIPSGVAVVEARASGAEGELEAWMRSTAGRPEIVALAERQRHHDLLAAGAAEVLPPDAEDEAVYEAIRRAEARATARAEGRRFRRIIEHTHDIVTVLDSFGRFTYVSPSVEDILGFAPEALVGTNAFETLVEDDVAGVMEVFLEAIGTPGTSRRLAYRSKT